MGVLNIKIRGSGCAVEIFYLCYKIPPSWKFKGQKFSIGFFGGLSFGPGIFWGVLLEALGIFLGLAFCPHSIIPTLEIPSPLPPPPLPPGPGLKLRLLNLNSSATNHKANGFLLSLHSLSLYISTLSFFKLILKALNYPLHSYYLD